MRFLAPLVIAVGVLLAIAGAWFLISPLPFGTTEITGGLAQQSEFIARSQITNAGGFLFIGGLLLAIMGMLLRSSGGKP